MAEFRRHAHLRSGSQVDHDTANRALDGRAEALPEQERLEAEIKLESHPYDQAAKREDFRFTAVQGPIVKVLVEGAGMSAERIKRILPIFEEGAVDDDLLNEGNRRLRDYYQRLGYFDVKAEHEQQKTSADEVVILYRVQLGPRRRWPRSRWRATATSTRPPWKSCSACMPPTRSIARARTARRWWRPT